MTIEKQLEELVTLDTVMDFEYLSQVMQEVLRYQAPATDTSPFECLEDFKAGAFNFQKGDIVQVYIPGLHYNTKEWKNPKEFNPDRFNPSSPDALRPDGKKRNPFAWAPFSGGKRVCFGKTFAEVNLKYLSIYMSEFFEYEYSEPEKYKDRIPISFALQPKTRPIWITLRNRKRD